MTEDFVLEILTDYPGRKTASGSFLVPKTGVTGIVLTEREIEATGKYLFENGARGYLKKSSLFPRMTVRDNLTCFAMYDGKDPDKVLEFAAKVGLNTGDFRKFDEVDNFGKYLALFVQAAVNYSDLYVFYADIKNKSLCSLDACQAVEALGKKSAVLVFAENVESLKFCDRILDSTKSSVPESELKSDKEAKYE
ncbi:MAG: hypothetical protein ACI4S9_06965 [Christensenellales bacterium]